MRCLPCAPEGTKHVHCEQAPRLALLRRNTPPLRRVCAAHITRRAPHACANACRPRGWHLEEKHLVVDGEPCSASLFDFGLYFYHNAAASLERGAGPYFYLPKMESHLEAR